MINSSFSFKLSKSTPAKFYFNCDQSGCSAKVNFCRTSGNSTIDNEHNHLGNIIAVKVNKAKNEIKQRCLDRVRDRPQDVVGDVLRGENDIVVANLPQIRTLTRNVRKNRSGIIASVNFLNLSEIHFPEEVLNLNGESILAFDSGANDQQRMLIFTTTELKEMFRSAKDIFMDGTFKIVPNLFYQLYTIHFFHNGLLVPGFYILLTGKTQELYEKVLEVIRELIETPRSEITFMIDLEIAAFNALRVKFPESRVFACSFHFRQVI